MADTSQFVLACKHAQDLHLVLHLSLLLHGDLSLQNLGDSLSLACNVALTLLFDLLHDLHVHGSFAVGAVLFVCKLLCCLKVSVGHSLLQKLHCQAIQLFDGANARHAHLVLPQPGNKLICLDVSGVLEALLIGLIEQQIDGEVILVHAKALAKVVVLFVAVLLNGNLRNQELWHRIGKLAHLLERIFFLAVRVGLVKLHEPGHF
mmetsp:Transcript_79642/g.192981  ORF Transcript_79642/g.192981 Transcript_79642/m.192981 type:complete len:205 (+) Transcript_79642:191-805(+)